MTRFVGIALLGLGLVFNKWLLEATVVPDGIITSRGFLASIVAVQLVLVSLGCWIILKRPTLYLLSWANWLLLTASVCLSIAAVEVALRLFAKSSAFRAPPRAVVGEFQNRPSRNFVVDPRTGWRMRPGVQFRWTIEDGTHDYQANRLGFRSPHDFEADMAEPTIALVGESFTFGTGVEYGVTYGALIEANLASGTVLNFAMPGFGLDQMWMSIRHQVILLKPDLVVVGFVDEDFGRSLTAFRPGEGFNKPTFELDANTRLRPQRPADRPHAIVRFLERHSALWNLANVWLRNLSYHWPMGEWLVKNAALIEAMVSDARSAEIPIVIVRIPNRAWRPFPTLRARLQENGVPYLDLADPGLRPQTDLHFKSDSHINTAGHAFVARHLGRWLDSANVLTF